MYELPISRIQASICCPLIPDGGNSHWGETEPFRNLIFISLKANGVKYILNVYTSCLVIETFERLDQVGRGVGDQKAMVLPAQPVFFPDTTPGCWPPPSLPISSL